MCILWLGFALLFGYLRKDLSPLDANVGIFPLSLACSLTCLLYFSCFLCISPLLIFISLYFLRVLKVQPEDKSQPYRDPKTGLCQVAGPHEVGLIVNVVNQKVLQSRFDGYSDESATNKKLLKDVLVKGDCYFNSGDLLSVDEEGFYYWSDRVGDTFRWKGEVRV